MKKKRGPGRSKVVTLGREQLLARAKRLVKFLEQLNAPAPLIADEVMLIWDAAELACGPDLYTRLGKMAVSAARRRAGFCNECDTEIGRAHTGDPLCEQCEAKLMDEFSE